MRRAWFLHAHNHMLEHQLMNCLLESLRSAWSSLGFIWWIDDLVIVTMEIVTTRLLWSVAETQRAGKACFGEIWRAGKCWRLDVKTHIVYIFSVDCSFLFLPRLHTGNRWFLWKDKYRSLMTILADRMRLECMCVCNYCDVSNYKHTAAAAAAAGSVIQERLKYTVQQWGVRAFTVSKKHYKKTWYSRNLLDSNYSILWAYLSWY